MPNHVKNRITLQGDRNEIKELINQFSTKVKSKLALADDGSIICSDDKGEFVGWYNLKENVFTVGIGKDRGKVKNVGLPEGYAFNIDEGYVMFPDFNKVIPQPENIYNGDLTMEKEKMCAKEGRPTWYNWNRKYWGTKWGGYSYDQIHDEYYFDTAWSSVPLILAEISRHYPNILIKYSWADEDTGSNCGVSEYQHGIEISKYIPQSLTREAYELSFKLNPDYKDNYELINGNYKYKEETE
jgi:hypothetical protein